MRTIKTVYFKNKQNTKKKNIYNNKRDNNSSKINKKRYIVKKLGIQNGGQNHCNHAGPDGISGCRDCCGMDTKCIDICMSTPMTGGERKKYKNFMKEKILKIEKSKVKNKKYTAKVINKKSGKTRKINFGQRGYQHFKDRTPLKSFKKLNHYNKKRQEKYYSRFSKGIKNRRKAIKYEERKSKGFYNPKLLSHIYLW